MSAAVESRSFRVSSDEVAAMDSWVEQVTAQWGESERTAFRARLCIAELAANVVEHGIARSGDGRIVVTLRRLGDGVGVEFQDSCEPFDPTVEAVVASAASIESVSPGGRGLMLIRAYANNISYSNDGGCNRTILKIKSV